MDRDLFRKTKHNVHNSRKGVLPTWEWTAVKGRINKSNTYSGNSVTY